MGTVVRCRCGWEGAVDETLTGQAIRCLACGKALVVPGSGAAARPSLPPVEAAQDASPASPPQVDPAAPASAPSPAPKFDARALLDRLRGLARRAWAYIRAAFGYYWSHRPQLRAGARLWITDYLPALDEPEDIRREIRTPLADEGRVREEAGVWHIDLPDRCVVCGGEPKGARIDEARSLLDPFTLIATPLAALGVGLVVGLWYRSLALLAVAPLAGVLIGYALRRTEEFRVRYRRCARHADDTSFPELAVFHRRLVLRFGSRDAKLSYLRHGNDGPAPGEMVPSLDPGASLPPETIALAESVEPDAAIIQDMEDRLPAAAEGYDLEKRSKRGDSPAPDDEVL